MNPVLSSSLAAARRAMKRHQGVPSERRVPMARLLAGEAAYALRSFTRVERGVPAVLAAAVVALGLSSATPGPVAPTPLLVVLVATSALLGGWAGARSLGSDSRSSGGPTSPWRGAILGVGAVVVLTALVVLVGWVIAAVVARVL